jgi:hypothetical protein
VGYFLACFSRLDLCYNWVDTAVIFKTTPLADTLTQGFGVIVTKIRFLLTEAGRLIFSSLREILYIRMDLN